MSNASKILFTPQSVSSTSSINKKKSFSVLLTTTLFPKKLFILSANPTSERTMHQMNTSEESFITFSRSKFDFIKSLANPVSEQLFVIKY